MAGSTVFQPGRSFALRGRLVIRPSGQGKALGGLTAQDTSTIVLGRQQQHPLAGGPVLITENNEPIVTENDQPIAP